ncbi:hypothetical protein AAEX37_02014 [Oligella sp. MSHR50489EDL]|uniref:Card1-like endonuclease domain-containing protein n=1 Tax=Oligella sp. MSHR50489EDL TaxID=3139409 RepID=UPI003D8140CC
MNVYICILSDQVLQNVLPLYRMAVDVACLIASEQMVSKGKDEQFSKLLSDLGLVEPENIVVLSEMPSSDYGDMCKWAKDQIHKIHHGLPEAKIYLNATGGTKLMSLAFVEACREKVLENKVEVIYCDTNNEKIEIIYPDFYTEPLAENLLSSEDILKAHSIRVKSALSDKSDWQKEVQERAELTRHLGQNMYEKLGSFIGSLNKELAKSLAQPIEKTQFPIEISLGKCIGSDWKEVLALMHKHKVIILDDELQTDTPAVFRIDDLEKARYLHGIWLEEYLWLCFNQAGISDVQSGMEIVSTHDDTEFKDNELDLVASYKNNLVIVECKTAYFFKDSKQQQAFDTALNKLSAISARSGGQLVKSWFATARWPIEKKNVEEKEKAERFRAHARSQGVVLIEPKYLRDLVDRLKEWKKTSRFPTR